MLAVRASVSFRLLGGDRRVESNGAAIDVAPRSISSPTLRSSAQEVDAGGEITKAIPPKQQRRSTNAPALVCVAPGCKLQTGTRVRQRRPGGTWSDCFAHVCVCPPREVKSAEQITGVGRLTRPLVRFLRHPWRLLGAGGRFWRGENHRDSAHMAWSPSFIANTDLRAARTKKYHRAKIIGFGPETKLGLSVSSPPSFFPAGRPSLPGS